MAEETARCPRCHGTGQTGPLLACGPTGSRWMGPEQCSLCGGTGAISGEHGQRVALGQRVLDARLALPYPLGQRQMAALMGVDSLTYSRAEGRGEGDPSIFERMQAWLDALAAERGG